MPTWMARGRAATDKWRSTFLAVAYIPLLARLTNPCRPPRVQYDPDGCIENGPRRYAHETAGNGPQLTLALSANLEVFLVKDRDRPLDGLPGVMPTGHVAGIKSRLAKSDRGLAADVEAVDAEGDD